MKNPVKEKLITYPFWGIGLGVAVSVGTETDHVFVFALVFGIAGVLLSLIRRD